MTHVPHFDYPFRFSAASKHAVEVEQDSVEEIIDCIQTTLLTNKGDRIELPDFGITNPLFEVQPLHLDDLYADVTDQEPRALIVLSQQPDAEDALTAIVTMTLNNEQPTIGGA
jgi:hypothetical protein